MTDRLLGLRVRIPLAVYLLWVLCVFR